MLIGKIHPGSGLGDQLFSYIATRVIALDQGYDFGFVGKEFFKGKDFMDLDWGKPCEVVFQIEEPAKKLVLPKQARTNGEEAVFEINKPYYDPEVNFIEDGTVIDGYGAQDIKYFEHRLDEVNKWLAVKPLEIPDDVCVLNFRGGEFQVFPELFLPYSYWNEGIEMVKARKYEVHTDDIETAKEFFPALNPTRDIALNWRSVRYAKEAVISNSAFAIIPRLLKHLEDPTAVTIAPRYWARRNIKEWSLPSNYYKKFTYI